MPTDVGQKQLERIAGTEHGVRREVQLLARFLRWGIDDADAQRIEFLPELSGVAVTNVVLGDKRFELGGFNVAALLSVAEQRTAGLCFEQWCCGTAHCSPTAGFWQDTRPALPGRHLRGARGLPVRGMSTPQ